MGGGLITSRSDAGSTTGQQQCFSRITENALFEAAKVRFR